MVYHTQHTHAEIEGLATKNKPDSEGKRPPRTEDTYLKKRYHRERHVISQRANSQHMNSKELEDEREGVSEKSLR